MNAASRRSGKVASDRASKSSIRAERAEAVRQDILDAALYHFARDGYQGAKLQQVANDSGSSMSLILYHFENKMGLWVAALERMATEVSRRYREFAHSAHADIRERVREIVRFQLQLGAELPEYHRIIIMESFQASERLQWLVDRHRSEFDLFRSIILEAEAAGIIRTLDPERLHYALIGVMTLPSIRAEYEIRFNISPAAPEELQRTERFLIDLLLG